MTFWRKETWCFVGFFCEEHLPVVAKNYGTIKVYTVAKEDIELDRRCTVLACKKHIEFSVERHGI